MKLLTLVLLPLLPLVLNAQESGKGTLRSGLIPFEATMPALVELELIEPELWMRRKPESAALFADAVLTVL